MNTALDKKKRRIIQLEKQGKAKKNKSRLEEREVYYKHYWIGVPKLYQYKI